MFLKIYEMLDDWLVIFKMNLSIYDKLNDINK